MAVPIAGIIVVERDDDISAALVRHAREADLMILGLHGQGGRRLFGPEVPRLVRAAPCSTLIISHGE